MSMPPFSWMWRDPAETLDRLRSMHKRMAKAEQDERDRLRRKKARRAQKLTKLAMARRLKGQA